MGGGSNEVPFSKVPGEFGKLLHFVVDARTAPTKTMSMMTAMLMTAACYHHDVFRISLNSVATLTITGVNTSGTKLFVR